MGRTPPGRHPVALRLDADRAADVQLRVADLITRFAGSMPFIYVHAVGFACWMLFVEARPWPTLAVTVSIEAIFLTSFVIIGQNRQVQFQLAKADHDFREQEQELRKNTELTRAIHALTTESHDHLVSVMAVGGARPGGSDRGDDPSTFAATGTVVRGRAVGAPIRSTEDGAASEPPGPRRRPSHAAWCVTAAPEPEIAGASGSRSDRALAGLRQMPAI